MLDENIRQQVLTFHKENKSLRDIATILNIGKSTVATIIKKGVGQTHSLGQTPKLIITEQSIEEKKMDNAVSDSFINSILEETSGGNGSNPGSDAFLESFMNDLDKPKKGRKPILPKAVKQRDSKVVKPIEVVESTVSKVEIPRNLEKGELIAKITLNVNAFSEVLSDFIKPNKEEFLNSLQKKTATELSAIMSSMDYSRSIHNTTNVLKHLTSTGASLIEMGTKRFLKMKTDGFASTIHQITELDTILKEIAMENQGGIISKYQSPTVRLSALLITTLMTIDARNRINISVNQPVTVAEKYNEL